MHDCRNAEQEFFLLHRGVGLLLFLNLAFNVDLRLHRTYGVEEEAQDYQPAHNLDGSHELCPYVGRGIVAETKCGDGHDTVIEPRPVVRSGAVRDTELRIGQSPVNKAEHRHEQHVKAYPDYRADIGNDMKEMPDFS